MATIRQVKQVTNGVARKDGKTVRFDVVTTDNETVTLEIASSEIGRFIAFLVGLAEHAAKNRSPSERPPSAPTQWEGSPIPVEHISLAPGKTAQEKVLVFYLGETSIGFALPILTYSALLELVQQIDSSGSSTSGGIH
jgi:hypothetical protein